MGGGGGVVGRLMSYKANIDIKDRQTLTVKSLLIDMSSCWRGSGGGVDRLKRY